MNLLLNVSFSLDLSESFAVPLNTLDNVGPVHIMVVIFYNRVCFYHTTSTTNATTTSTVRTVLPLTLLQILVFLVSLIPLVNSISTLSNFNIALTLTTF